MSTSAEFTFDPYVFASQQAVNAAGPLTSQKRVRDRFGSIQIAKVGDYIIKDEDGSLRVMPAARFEAEYSAASAPTAPNTLTRAASTTTTIDLSWTVGSATALPHIEKAGVEIAVNAANDGTYTATGLTANTGYSFRVRNSLNEAYSAYLTPLVAYTLPLPIAAAPTTTDVAATTVDIAWVNADAAAETEVHVAEGAGGFSIFATVDPGEDSVQITGLTTATAYHVKLKHKGVVSDLVSATFSPTLDVTTD